MSWVEVLDPEGHVEVRTRRTGDGYDVEWMGLARMHVGASVQFLPLNTAHPRAVEKLRRGPAAAVERYLRRTGIGFHAAAVAVGDRGLLLAGESGIGKSTAAAFMVQCGCSLLADDVAILGWTEGRAMVQPTEAEHLLDGAACKLLGVPEDVMAEKASIPTRRAAARATPLIAIVEMRIGVAWGVERVRGKAAMLLLAKARACPPVDEPARMLEDLEILARLNDMVAIYRLERPERPQTQRLHDLLTSLPEFQ